MIECSRCNQLIFIDDDDYVYEMTLTQSKRYNLLYDNRMTVKTFICCNCFEELVEEAKNDY